MDPHADPEVSNSVREHHAPVGALRPNLTFGKVAPRRQGAPRTCRCIETHADGDQDGVLNEVREHHAPVGALRHPGNNALVGLVQGQREHHAPVATTKQDKPPLIRLVRGGGRSPRGLHEAD